MLGELVVVVTQTDFPCVSVKLRDRLFLSLFHTIPYISYHSPSMYQPSFLGSRISLGD